MTLDSNAVLSHCKIGTLVQLVLFIPQSQNTFHRIGKVHSVSSNYKTIVLEPHHNKLVSQAYGSDIMGKFAIEDVTNVIEIIVLNDDEISLKKIIKENTENAQ